MKENSEIAVAINSSERLKLVYNYWLSIRGDRSMPSRKDFDPAKVAKALPGIAIVEVLRDPIDFRYRLIGTDIDYHSEKSHTGQLISEIPDRAAPNTVWQNFINICKSKLPSGRTVPYVGPHSEFLETRQIVLPFSNDDKNVHMVMAVIDYLRRPSPFDRN